MWWIVRAVAQRLKSATARAGIDSVVPPGNGDAKTSGVEWGIRCDC
jgi:hypothetical protein